MMPPVDVPAITSTIDAIGRPVRRSISARTSAGINPRIPPPSIASAFTAPSLRGDGLVQRFGIAEARGIARSAADDVVGRAVRQEAAVAHAVVAGLRMVADHRERG